GPGPFRRSRRDRPAGWASGAVGPAAAGRPAAPDRGLGADRTAPAAAIVAADGDPSRTVRAPVRPGGARPAGSGAGARSRGVGLPSSVYALVRPARLRRN